MLSVSVVTSIYFINYAYLNKDFNAEALVYKEEWGQEMKYRESVQTIVNSLRRNNDSLPVKMYDTQDKAAFPALNATEIGKPILDYDFGKALVANYLDSRIRAVKEKLRNEQQTYLGKKIDQDIVIYIERMSPDYAISHKINRQYRCVFKESLICYNLDGTKAFEPNKEYQISEEQNKEFFAEISQYYLCNIIHCD